MNPEQNSVPTTTKQQIVDTIKKANNVLITVSQNPSIDQLSSCIGLALILNKLNKHATAIFSGTVPSTIEFLQPEKTLETTTDSLRDFIISLDRDKADKLRYKVEDNVVRIFITPYRTSITQDDLIFSQGDFNVDVVLALGVDQREHLDLAIMQQGRILHDAVVVGVSCGVNPSNVGSINWHEPSASSISELVLNIAESIKPGLLDAQIATALLTGIVAETDRFRNEKTNAKVMSISAQLMASGANQQLVAEQLEIKPKNTISSDGSIESSANPDPDSFNVPKKDDKELPPEGTVSLHIDSNTPAPAVQLPGELTDEEIKKIKIDAAGIIHDDLPIDTANPLAEKPETISQLPEEQESYSVSSYVSQPPERGGTLTASGMEDAMTELPAPMMTQPSSSYPILSHGSPLSSNALSKSQEKIVEDNPNPSNVVDTHEVEASTLEPEFDKDQDTDNVETLDKDQARKAVLEAMASEEFSAPTPIMALNAQPMDLSAPANVSTDQSQLPPPPLPPPITPMSNMPNPVSPVPVAMENENQPPALAPQGKTPFNLPPP